MEIFENKYSDSRYPLLLAGPILRRVDKSKVCVWIATSKNVDSCLRVYQADDHQPREGKSNPNSEGKNNKGWKEIGAGSSSSVRLGDNLFVTLMIAKPYPENLLLNEERNTTAFPVERILAYDFELFLKSNNQTSRISLADLGLLSGPASILYKDVNTLDLDETTYSANNHGPMQISLPTFYIRDKSNVSKLNILFGSCRKLHGEDVDSLVIADSLILNSLTNLQKRPSALFLMGDQIYADDVAGPLIKHLTRFAKDLLGWEEYISGLDKKLSETKIGERKSIVTNLAHFSSESSHNHLLSFGEFAGMYLMTWNPEIWPFHFPKQPKLNDEQDTPSISNYNSELSGLEQSRKELYKIRRILANIPTYMICDDHEITDDWNINKRWVNEVNASIAGRQIITNGMIAYWAFQAWGNDPDAFDDEFIKLTQTYLKLRRQNGLQNVRGNSNVFPTRVKEEIQSDEVKTKIRQIEDLILDANKWTFVAPTYPFSVFLDCRTRRKFNDLDGPPILVDDENLSSIRSMLIKLGYAKGDPIIMISPTPVFGFELAEGIQRFLTSLSGTYKWDLETWSSNEDGFVKFLTFIQNSLSPEYCIFLSGDVHYAFTMRALFSQLDSYTSNIESHEKKRPNLEQSPLQIAQLTSSPFRSNHLNNRIVAILILNLAHLIKVTKKKILTPGINHDYRSYFQLINKKFTRINFYFSNKSSNTTIATSSSSYIHFSYHKENHSVLTKSRTIISNLIRKYVKHDYATRVLQDPVWVESRQLVLPKTLTPTPVLPKNNIGQLYLNMGSKSLKHILYYFTGNKVEQKANEISFDN